MSMLRATSRSGAGRDIRPRRDPPRATTIDTPEPVYSQGDTHPRDKARLRLRGDHDDALRHRPGPGPGSARRTCTTRPSAMRWPAPPERPTAHIRGESHDD